MSSYNKVVSIHMLIHTTLLSWLEFFQIFNTRRGGCWGVNKNVLGGKKNQKLISRGDYYQASKSTFYENLIILHHGDNSNSILTSGSNSHFRQ